MPIDKSQGVTPTERLLNGLCDRTFLKLWSFANPFKDDGHELCDLLAVFEDHVFIFFDRQSELVDLTNENVDVSWGRWKRKVIDEQIATAHGAERYLRSGRIVYLDAKSQVLFPFLIDSSRAIFHKIIVAHGASQACRNFSDTNVYGSLAICYGDVDSKLRWPFFVQIDRAAASTHIFDSDNLEIILGELDTIADFSAYLNAKEEAIRKYDLLSYCGEEDLLAHYLLNFDYGGKKHFIGTKDTDINGIHIGEGEWQGFSTSEIYKRTKAANVASYLWDDILQTTCDNALKGKLLGNSALKGSRSALIEMAKEPRFSRRALSIEMKRAVQSFPDPDGTMKRQVTFMPSVYPGKGFVFLQIGVTPELRHEHDFREKRQEILQIACGAAKIKMNNLNTIIGIGIESPKYTTEMAEDFLLMDCSNWSDSTHDQYETMNESWSFFCSPSLRKTHRHVTEFLSPSEREKRGKKIGRNERCPCGSGVKFKRCHGTAR